MKAFLLASLFCGVCLVNGNDRNTFQNMEARLRIMEESFLEMKKEFQEMKEGKSRDELPEKMIDNKNLKAKEILSGGSKMNDTDLEQRVGILEFQMSSVIDDVTTVTDDVNDVETQVTLLQADVTLIEADQNVQDQRILELETDAEAVAAAIFRLDNDVSGLKSADNNLNSSILQLDTKIIELEAANVTVQSKIVNLENVDSEIDERLSKLELDGAVAFNAALGNYESLPLDTVVVFPDIIMNLGNGYDGATGEFTVPPGGAGLYYFYMHVMIYHAKFASFDLRLNGARFCRVRGGEQPGMPDQSTSSCGAAILLNEGDIVDVYYDGGTDDIPVIPNNEKQNTFSGFRIAPES